MAVSKVRMPRSQRMTFGLPAERMYSAESRNSWMRGGHAALEQDRLADLAHPAQQGEVLDVARPDLEDVAVLRHHLHALGLEHLGDHRQPGALARLRQVAEPLLLQPLEGVGRGARLVGAAPQDLGPRCLDRVRHLEHLRLGLDRAGPRHHHHVVAAHRDPVDAHLARLAAHLAAGQLERLLHRHDRLDGLHRLEQAQVGPAALLADRGHDGLELAADHVGAVAHLGDAAAHLVHVGVADAGLEHDDHAFPLLLALLVMRGSSAPTPPGRGHLLAENKNAAGWLPAASICSLAPRAGSSARGSFRSAHGSQEADGGKVKIRTATRGCWPSSSRFPSCSTGSKSCYKVERVYGSRFSLSSPPLGPARGRAPPVEPGHDAVAVVVERQGHRHRDRA